MSRLGFYLTRLFFGEAGALTLVVVPLLFLVQCFRILDVITVKGQDIGTLLGQAALALPLIGSVFFYVCAAIGLARALGAMQLSGELHAIHSSRKVGTLIGSALFFATAISIFVLGLSHLGSPASLKNYDTWTANIAGDLVGRALTPNRFAEVVPGVTVVIGSREGEGQITDFFADDRRDPLQRRTYNAASAVVAQDDEGYVLRMADGSVQYMTDQQRFSEIRFKHYDMAVELLTDQAAAGGNLTSLDLIEQALATNTWEPRTVFLLVDRTAEGLRVFGLCLLVVAIAGFPHARRTQGIPLELAVLAIAFFDRGITTYAPDWLGILRPAAGALFMTAAGALILMYRLWFAEHVRRLFLVRARRAA